MTVFRAIFYLKKDISKLLNKLGHIHEEHFMSQLHNFLHDSQNIYQLQNLRQMRVSLFRPGVVCKNKVKVIFCLGLLILLLLICIYLSIFLIIDLK